MVDERPAPLESQTDRVGQILLSDRDGKRTWVLAPGEGAEFWGDWLEKGIACVGWNEAGDLRRYQDKHQLTKKVLETGYSKIDALALWEFYRVMKRGDTIFAKKGKSHVVGHGVVRSDYRFETKEVFHHVRRVEWQPGPRDGVKTGEKNLPNKTLTELTDQKLVAHLSELLQTEDPGPRDEEPNPFSVEDASRDLFLGANEIRLLVELLKRKKNLILQGPPGTGKTFVARRLAWLLAETRSEDRIEFVQFHQSYGYEDFVRGYRPTVEGGFELQDGPFLRFCDRAREAPDRPHVLIIDEINRGDLSRIFGELLLLIEADKRADEWAVRTAYARPDAQPFHVPQNLYLLGTMNTADRSLALVDYALRRRFAFETLAPAFESDGFGRHLSGRGVPASVLRRIRERIGALNRTIRDDKQLGKGFEIGHSYFCDPPEGEGADHDDWYRTVVEYEIRPLLEEYWFDESNRAEDAVAALRTD